MYISGTHKNNYSKYLRGDAWRKLRDSALDRARWKCHICKELATEVHHLWYSKRDKITKGRQLVALCHRCHVAIHKIMPNVDNHNMTREEIRFIVCVIQKELHLKVNAVQWNKKKRKKKRKNQHRTPGSKAADPCVREYENIFSLGYNLRFSGGLDRCIPLPDGRLDKEFNKMFSCELSDYMQPL